MAVDSHSDRSEETGDEEQQPFPWAGRVGDEYGGQDADDPRGLLVQALEETDEADRGVEIASLPEPADQAPRGGVREAIRTLLALDDDCGVDATGRWYPRTVTPTRRVYQPPSDVDWPIKVEVTSPGVTQGWYVRVEGDVPDPFRPGDFHSPVVDHDAAMDYAERLMSWLSEYYHAEQRDDHAVGTR